MIYIQCNSNIAAEIALKAIELNFNLFHSSLTIGFMNLPPGKPNVEVFYVRALGHQDIREGKHH